jgi:hypothetical protein
MLIKLYVFLALMTAARLTAGILETVGGVIGELIEEMNSRYFNGY